MLVEEQRLSELWAKQKVKKLNCERHTEREREPVYFGLMRSPPDDDRRGICGGGRELLRAV